MKKFIILIILLSCTACSGQSAAEMDVPEQTADDQEDALQSSPTPRPTVIPTAAVPACDDHIAVYNEWTTIYCDNFDDNRNEWASVETDNLADSIYQIEDGKLVVDFSGIVNQNYLSGVVQWRPITEADNYAVSVKGKIISDYQNATWGINFHEGYDGFYSFMLSNNGAYWLDQYKDDKWTPLINLRSNSAIKWEEENELVIVVEGENFQFYVNGELINSIQSDALTEKTISLAVWTAEGVKARFEFDDIVVKQK